MLIDPPYEIKSDYTTLPGAIVQLHRKWNVGVIALWYPILTSQAEKGMITALKAAGFPNILHHEVRFPPAREGHGMIGSGLFVLNAPWGLSEEARQLTELFSHSLTLETVAEKHPLCFQLTSKASRISFYSCFFLALFNNLINLGVIM